MTADPVAVGNRFLELLDRPRKLGFSDCVMIPATIYQEFLGIDLLSGFNKWTTEIGFVRALRKAGYENIVEAIAGAAMEHGAWVVNSGEPLPLDLGWFSFRVGENVHYVPAIFLDGLWCGVLHTHDGERNLLTTSNVVGGHWRF